MKAPVRSLTAERGRRGRLPWTFTIDVGRNSFQLDARGATPADLLALAAESDLWAKALKEAAAALRKAVKEHAPRTRVTARRKLRGSRMVLVGRGDTGARER